MGTLASLELTTTIRAALDAIDRAERLYVPGRDSSSVVDLPKLALADAVRAAIATRRVRALPTHADRGVVYVQLKPARKRRA